MYACVFVCVFALRSDAIILIVHIKSFQSNKNIYEPALSPQ